MKLRLKLTATVILLLLVLVCAYQIYWLTNFHKEQYEKVDSAVRNAMENADYKEVAMRIFDVQMLPDTITPRSSAMEDLMKDSSYYEKMPDIVVRIHGEKYGKKAYPEEHMWNNTQVMNRSILQGLHRVIDSMEVVSTVRYDSLIHDELSRIDIKIPYQLKHIRADKDSIFDTPDLDKNKYKEYVFHFSEDGKDAYFLYLEEPEWHVFKNMINLVIVSVLMIILLIVSYVYLLKIILRQKTVDEIKSDFVNNMTHELKTPISVTYAAIDAMHNFGIADDTEKRDKYLTISKEQLMYLNSLVEQILTMSVEERKNLKLSLEAVNIQELFEKQQSQFLLNATKNIDLKIDVEPENLMIQADKLHFGNVMNNLIENAIKYSAEDVSINISAEKTDNKTTVVRVSDNGIGIPKGSVDKIFDKFYRVSTGNIHNVKGYGLGLFYVKTIVDKHGWDIEVESTEGKGTCFKIIVK